MTDRHFLPPYSLRLPGDLRPLLQDAADCARRSLNAEIVARLEDSFLPRQSLSVLSGSTSPELIEATRQQLRALIQQASQLLDGLDALQKS